MKRSQEKKLGVLRNIPHESWKQRSYTDSEDEFNNVYRNMTDKSQTLWLGHAFFTGRRLPKSVIDDYNNELKAYQLHKKRQKSQTGITMDFDSNKLR